jgi:hypothetical protein
MPQQVVEIPSVRYLCGLEESWDQPPYIYPLREEDAGWTTVTSGKRHASKKGRGKIPK